MASYTMQLREIIEHYSQDQYGLDYKERIELGRQHLFNFEYPFFSESYRDKFEENFIKNFYTREIGFETENLFKLKLDTWLNINMNYYNKLFESECLKFNPLHNTEINTTYNKKNDRKQSDKRDHDRTDNRMTDVNSNTTGKTTGESESTASGSTTHDNFNRNIESDTPQNRLELTTRNGEGVIEYASKIDEQKQLNESDSQSKGNTKSTDNSTVDSTSKASDDYNMKFSDLLDSKAETIEDYVQRQTGKIGSQSFSKMLQEYRSTFIRVERMIFEEMEQLFMGVY